MQDRLRSIRGTTWVAAAIISFVFAFCCVFGISYVEGEGYALLPFGAEAALTLCAMPLFAAVLLAGDRLFFRIADRPCGPSLPERRVPLPVLGVIMAVLWSPWLIANVPGSSFFDTYFQIYQFYPHDPYISQIPDAAVADNALVHAWLVDHHPWLTSIIYGSIAQLSQQLTGTWMMGFFVFSTVQALLYIVLFVRLIGMMRAWGVAKGARAACFAFICLMPVFPVWSSCVMKDSLFGLFFFSWFLMLVECVLSRGGSLSSPRQLIVMFVLALMMCLTKKTGTSIVVVTAVVACVVYRRRRGAVSPFSAFALQGAGCALLMFAIIPLAVFPALNIAPGGKQEALGFVFQQTARYAQVHELTPEEERIIDEVVPIDVVKNNYHATDQDRVKYRFNTRVSDEALMQYLGLHLQQGLRDPEAYFASIMPIAGMYVAPTTEMNLRMVTVDSDFYGAHVLWNPEELDPLREGLDAAYKAAADVPVLNLPLLMVVYALWIPGLVLFVSVRHRLRLGLLFVPLAVVLAFCIVGPVYDARYAWGLILAAPVLFALAVRPRCWWSS